MTAIALDIDLSNRANSMLPLSTATNFEFGEFSIIELDQQPDIHYLPFIKATLGGSILSAKQESAAASQRDEIIIETLSTTRNLNKLLLERKILGFLNLDGLDDKESIDLLTKAVPEALVFIEELPDAVPLPEASIGFDGIVTLEWVQGAKRAAAMFEGDDDYGYTYYRNGRYVPGTKTAVAGNGIPDDLTTYLTV